MTISKESLIQPDTESLLARKGPAVRRPGPEALARVRNVVAIGSGKGGVGKSTVTTNLAVALQKRGAKVAVLDADIYGPSQPGLLGAKGVRAESESESILPLDRHGVGFMSMGLVMPSDGPVVWRAPMAMKALFQFLTNVEWGDLDYLLIDLPPGTGDVQLTIAQQAPLSGSVVVTTPQDVALNVARKGLQMFQQVKVPILGVVENMSGFTCSHCGTEHWVFKKEGGKALAEESGTAFLGRIPLETDIMSGGDAGEPVLIRNPQSPAAQAFMDLARRFEAEVARVNDASPVGEPKNVVVQPSGELHVEWADGHHSDHSGWSLRVRCPCASCVDEDTGRRVLDPKKVPLDIKVVEVHPVGRYGMGISFSDGHSTGIYRFETLRSAAMEPTPLPQGSPAEPPRGLAPVGGLQERVVAIINAEINPGLAQHGGRAELVAIKEGVAEIRLSGGCQGCGAAKMTLSLGIERTLRAKIPDLAGVRDVTDHASGERPYFAGSGQSPFAPGGK